MLSVCLMGESITFCAAGWERLREEGSVRALWERMATRTRCRRTESDPWLLSPLLARAEAAVKQPTSPGPPGFHKCHRDPPPHQ